jgi:hypothetical protein
MQALRKASFGPRIASGVSSVCIRCGSGVKESINRSVNFPKSAFSTMDYFTATPALSKHQIFHHLLNPFATYRIYMEHIWN